MQRITVVPRGSRHCSSGSATAMLTSMKHTDRSAEAGLALDGLSIGDAFGEQFFGSLEVAQQRLLTRQLPPAPWRWTDDTAMALGIVEVLRESGDIDPDHLALVFARNYRADPMRGYGGGAHQVLGVIASGGSWRDASQALFGGTGSYGNGAAMRGAPIGGFFSDDLDRCARAAVASAVPTHSHPDGVAGAVAIAIAGALLASARSAGERLEGRDFLSSVLSHVPRGAVRSGLETAIGVEALADPAHAGMILGSGEAVAAADTVPFCLWIVAWHQASFSEALWATVSALGDRDTTCAIVGGLMALARGRGDLPGDWIDAREPLPMNG